MAILTEEKMTYFVHFFRITETLKLGTFYFILKWEFRLQCDQQIIIENRPCLP